jgi:hypothetical protein
MQKELCLILFYCLISGVARSGNHFQIYLRTIREFPFREMADTLVVPGIRVNKTPPVFLQINDSTAVSISLLTGPCKETSFSLSRFANRLEPVILTPPPETMQEIKAIPATHRYAHGDLSYDFYQHKTPDTSFVGNSFTQHQVIANLYVKVGKDIPVIIHFSTLQTSLPYVKNYVDGSIQFDQQQYNSSMLENVGSQIKRKIGEINATDSLMHNKILQEYNTNQNLSVWLNSDRQLQQLVSSTQLVSQYQQYSQVAHPEISGLQGSGQQLLGKDSAVNEAMGKISKIQSLSNTASMKNILLATADSASKHMDSTKISAKELKKAIAFIKEYADKLQALNNSKKIQDSLKVRYDSLHIMDRDRRDSLENQLNTGNLKDLVKEYGDSTSKNGTNTFLMGVRKLSIGLSYIDYSELSARNINIMGINFEYYNKYYVAFAAGKTDFRYLDFLTPTAVANQWLVMGRFGVGAKEDRHVYFTAYTGRKQASYYINNKPATNKLTGFTIEAKIPINKNIYLTAEVAKSTYPQYVASSSSPGKLFGFSDRNNEAYSLQVYGYLPKSDTRFYGVYNRLGVYFQSFNIFNNNANSSSWQVRLDQFLLKKKLLLSASVRQNDYSTPYLVNTFKSQSLFYSFQASLRLPKWPILTFGFLPYSQLTNINGQLEISRFYTMLGTANYSTRINKSFLNTSLVYTRYFNSSSQQGFLFYDATSWYLNQSVLIKKFTFSAMANVSYSPGYFLFSTGPGIQWRVTDNLQVGAGVKYNELDHVQTILGYNGNIDYSIGKLGRVSISYDRGYIPGYHDTLFRNDWGRATYSKYF